MTTFPSAPVGDSAATQPTPTEVRPDGRLHADGSFTWLSGARPAYLRDQGLPCDFYLKPPATQPAGQEALPLAPATEQQKLRDLADRIDHEELWRRSTLDRFDGKMTPEQVDRMDAGVALRRYAELLAPGRWLVFPPAGGIRFSASTLAAAAGMAQRDEERRAARAVQAGDGKP